MSTTKQDATLLRVISRMLHPSSRYLRVRESSIHGRGLFSKRPIKYGDVILEYSGPLVEAEHAEECNTDGRIFLMSVEIGGKVVYIDGRRNEHGWAANHSCTPNMDVVTASSRVFFVANRDITAKEELTIRYDLVDANTKNHFRYACRCGSSSCQGTMLDQSDVK